MEKDVKLTDEQLEILKGIVMFTEAYCNQVYHIMQNHGLDKIDGCGIRVTVDPSYEMTNRNILLGNPDSDFGYCNISRGKYENEYTLYGRNSCTFEELFGRHRITVPDVKDNVPLPEDGFWF